MRGCVPLLHGSQGCSTYIRRYLIGHFREPCDIPASNFDESAAIFGGEAILTRALANVTRQFSPELVGVATTCLSETIGDDVPSLLRKAVGQSRPDAPQTLHVSTPSYAGTHAEGFHRAVRALVERTVADAPRQEDLVALFPSIVSPADLRHLRELARACGKRAGARSRLRRELGRRPVEHAGNRSPRGPRDCREIAGLGAAGRVIALGGVLPRGETAADLVASRAGREALHLDLPIGVRATDLLVSALGGDIEAGRPSETARERSLLLDSYVDAHKLVSGRKVAIWGEVDLVVALCAFCHEIGLVPVVCASGSADRTLTDRIEAQRPTGAPRDAGPSGQRLRPDRGRVPGGRRRAAHRQQQGLPDGASPGAAPRCGWAFRCTTDSTAVG